VPRRSPRRPPLERPIEAGAAGMGLVASDRVLVVLCDNPPVCGIAGILSFDGKAPPPSQDDLWAMARTLRHRGPDEENAVVRDQQVGLAHTRLSIIDLAGGKQPMSTADDALWVTFNGEIFNHVELRADLEARGAVFRTRSDTEVILHAYALDGIRCVESFNGQFAFALWDARRRRLILARDRYGVRPLYLMRAGGRLAFASEVKALLALPGAPRRLDPRGLGQVFQLWAPLAPQTVFEGITQLPPGHVLVVESDGTEKLTKFWDWPFGPSDGIDRARPLESWMEEVRETLIGAVKLRLMRSDVPVGAYLSGGLDSSIIATAVRRFSSAPLRTFSVTFEDKEFDESDYQGEVIASLGTDHTAVRCTRADIGAAFPRAIWHTEAPVLRTAPTPMLVLAETVHKAGYKVVLTGEGADEVFAGYDLFKEAAVRRFAARHPNSAGPPRLFERLYPYLPQAPALGSALGKAFFQQGGVSPEDPFFAHAPRWSTTRRTWRFFSGDMAAALEKDDTLDRWRETLPSDIGSWEPLARDQYVEGHSLLSGYLLAAQGDRVAMASSVEGRFPFLDLEVSKLASRVPAAWKLFGLREKHLLKRSFEDLLPARVIRRPKQPYRAPDSASFVDRGQLLPYVAALLEPGHVRSRGYFEPDAVARLAQKCKDGRTASFGDNMAFVGVLSTMLLDWMYISGNGPDVSTLR
jgi:asparagine synthase (glutamine-hydrolysing)